MFGDKLEKVLYLQLTQDFKMLLFTTLKLKINLIRILTNKTPSRRIIFQITGRLFHQNHPQPPPESNIKAPQWLVDLEIKPTHTGKINCFSWANLPCFAGFGQIQVLKKTCGISIRFWTCPLWQKCPQVNTPDSVLKKISIFPSRKISWDFYSGRWSSKCPQLPFGELTFCYWKWPFIDIYSGFSH